MPSFLEISPEKLNRLIGTPSAPVLIDVRTDEDFHADPRLIPDTLRRPYDQVAAWAEQFTNQPIVTICQKGKKLSQGVAAYLRTQGTSAEVLDNGFEACSSLDLPLVPTSRLPERDAQGQTVWVTRSRPKIDRITCPWLIRRFVDPGAVFLFVVPVEVVAVAERFGATPFDVNEVFWSHRGERCTFDVMIEEFGLSTPPLLHLATIVRGADTARPDLAPEVAGLLAESLGLSRIFNNDLQ